MSTHKHIDRICVIAVVISIIISVLFMNGEAIGIVSAANTMGYENRLFDTSKVHTIDIVMDDWDSFISTCQSEEYSECTVIIDGETYKNTAIRGKGNTSLSTVSSMDSSRYSFKVEFDHYDSNKSYHGLDKLSLNNIIQDNTYMKDYLTYRMMYEFGVNAPLCSYAFLTVNGEDWGLYLAVEGIEDSFLQRNYGNNYGELYKPDSMSFGGGRGNGKEFDIGNFMGNFPAEKSNNAENSDMNDGEIEEGSDNKKAEINNSENTETDFSQRGGRMPGGAERSFVEGGRGGMGGMGSSDVKLQYIDDNADSYSNIFNNAKTDITDEDKERLISSLKSLSENADIENVVNTDEVIRYFVVHNFVCNGDSYTGSMIHNYYLYEESGQLFMIPWDYNLAFGTFQSDNASEQVNSPIDTPVSGDISDRPMISWIFASEEYTELYHRYFSEFLQKVNAVSIIDETKELISAYVKKDPTAFCTYEEFETGVSAIRTFCELRTESVKGQLDGTIPSTSDGQTGSSALIDTGSLKLSDMGTMNMGGNRGGFDGRGREQNFSGMPQTDEMQTENQVQENVMQMSEVQPTGTASGEGTQINQIQPPDNTNGEFPQSEQMQPPDNTNGGTTQFEGMGTPPENSENFTSEFPSEMPDFSDFNNMRNPQNNNSVPESNTDLWLLLGISALFLIGGLLFAIKFRR